MTKSYLTQMKPFFISHAIRMKVILFTCTESFDELTSRRLGFLDPGISSHSLDITSKKKKQSDCKEKPMPFITIVSNLPHLSYQVLLVLCHRKKFNLRVA